MKIKIRTETIGLKNELKYSPVSEGNTCISEPKPRRGITLKNNSVKDWCSFFVKSF